ncbi:MAG: tetratricopeptide repeat protein, partial [Bryobacteraceae bacterium]|nr:tetratricopeptide repeat protein [Bryobacteraceae bacterium]
TYLKRGRSGDRQKAEAEFRAAIERAPNHAVAHTRLGQICLARKEYQAAAEHFVRALRAEKDVEACRGMAVALAAMGRPVEAQYHWGLFYTRKDLRPRSAEAFRKMQELDPERTEATLLLTETYVRMKQEQRGVALVEAALARHPDDPVLHERLAALHFASGNRRDARQACERWLRLQPEAAAPHWILGKIAVDALRLEEGLPRLEQAVARDPKNAEYAYALAVALLKRPTPENRERARELLHRVIRLAPDVARYRNQFGLLLRADGDPEAALRQFLLSLDLDPHEPPSDPLQPGLQPDFGVGLACDSLKSVAQEIHENLLEQRRVRGPLQRIRRDFETHVLTLAQPLGLREQPGFHLAPFRAAQLRFWRPAIQQQVVDQPLDPLHLFHGRLQQLPRRPDRLLGHQLDEAFDRPERVPDFVGQCRGHLAKLGKMLQLKLAQLQPDRPARGPDRIQRQSHKNQSA